MNWKFNYRISRPFTVPESCGEVTSDQFVNASPLVKKYMGNQAFPTSRFPDGAARFAESS
jgi:hypothetical protein